MLYDGLILLGGSQITNATIPTGTATDRTNLTNPNNGEMFYQTDGDSGLYGYSNGSWVKLQTADNLNTHAADATIHRQINDSGTGTTELWSASKISTELAGKSDTSHDHDADYIELSGDTMTGALSLPTTPSCGDVGTQATIKNYIDTQTKLRNVVINGNFDIWQRGTTASTPGTGHVQRYAADRWCVHSNIVATCTRAAFTLGQTDVPNEPTYYIDITGTATDDVNDYIQFLQYIEDVTTFAGSCCMLSFYAKGSVAGTVGVDFTQLFIGDTYTWTAQNFDVTTSWQRYVLKFNLPSVSGRTIGTSMLVLAFRKYLGSFWNTDGPGPQYNPRPQYQGTLSIAQVQLEAGSIATDFEPRLLGEELELCYRYYNKSYSYGTLPGATTSSGAVPTLANGNGYSYWTLKFPTKMRIAPTITPYSFLSGTAGKAVINGVDVDGNIWQVGDTYASAWAYNSTGQEAGSYIHWTADAEF